MPALAAANDGVPAPTMPFTVAPIPGSGTPAVTPVVTFHSDEATKTFTVTQNDLRAVLVWSVIELKEGETLNFDQLSGSQSITLNRSSGTTPFKIDGTITAQGQVWILNPNGTVIGSTGSVNAAGFLATTANITDVNFFNNTSGSFVFSDATEAAITNEGQINVPSGYAVLAGRNVENRNSGALISATLGKIALGGGRDFTIDFAGNGLVSFLVADPTAATTAGDTVSNFSNSVKNSGTIEANGGTILMTVRSAVDIIGNVINTTGIVQAQTVSSAAGVITLDAGPNGLITVGSSSVGGKIDASGGAGVNGGTITLTASSLDVKAASTLLANGGSTGTGGTINLLGNLDNSQSLTQIAGTLQADGGTSGGNGGTIDIQAYSLVQTSDSELLANAGSTGNGGIINLHGNLDNSQSSMQIAGTLQADGGTSSGSGGTIDIQAYSLEQTSDSELLANAGSTGNGGIINLLGNLENSQSSMQIAGTLQADGGTNSGNGGTIDIKAYSLEQSMVASASGLAGNINIASASIDVVETIATGGLLGNSTSMTALSLGDDNVAANVPLGFTFNYNGEAYTSVDISSNGFLTFGNLSTMNSDDPSYCCQGLPLSSASAPRNSVFALWTDLIDLTNPYYTTTVLDGKTRFTLG